MRLYHYTFEKCVESIINDGNIKGSSIGFSGNDVDLVWLSSNINLEMSIKKSNACKDITFATMNELLCKTGGIFRFSFEYEEDLFKNWALVRSSSPIPRSVTSVMKLLGGITGADCSEWYAHVGNALSIKDAQLEVCQKIDRNGTAIWKQVMLWKFKRS